MGWRLGICGANMVKKQADELLEFINEFISY